MAAEAGLRVGEASGWGGARYPIRAHTQVRPYIQGIGGRGGGLEVGRQGDDRWGGVGGGHLRCWQSQWQGEVEGAALAGFGLNADATAMQLDEQAGDGEAKTRATDLAGWGSVHLGEGLEEAGLIGEGNAGASIDDAYDDLGGEGGGAVFCEPGGGLVRGGKQGRGVAELGEKLDLDGDGARIGKLGGIGEQVDEHLAEAGGVCAQGGKIGGNLFDKGDRFIFGETDRGGHGGGDQIAKVNLVIES